MNLTELFSQGFSQLFFKCVLEYLPFYLLFLLITVSPCEKRKWMRLTTERAGAGVRQRTPRSLHIIYATSIMAFFPIKLSLNFLPT